MKIVVTHLIATLLILPLFSQSALPDLNKKEVVATRINTAPKIDGRLDDEIWLDAKSTSNFTQQEPNPGGQPSQKTEVSILYDNYGIYIAARLYDSHPDSIQKELSERDNLGNTEWFGVFIDAYQDGINGFGFIVTPSNVQFDTKYSTFGEDENWDGVWESNVSINSEGWVAEMRIPYSAIRFPNTQAQKWHINFGRKIARTQEKNWWSEINPEVTGFLNQFGYLTGIENIVPPLRLQATPFIAVYGQQHHDKNADPVNTYGHSFNGGMDVKWGLSDAFTLDMTLIPDFGEAQSDDKVLNLSPFEVRFDENRAFFTEGTELFNKGGLFYSRRIGGRPINYWEVEDEYEGRIKSNPQQAQLYNATKISGRNTNGLGIGFFNATSARTYAEIEDDESGDKEVLTDPLTNYNVLVLDQNLKNNSYATFINTTVLREGDFYDANVTGTEFLLRNKANTYAIEGTAALSQKYYTDETDLGHRFAVSVSKTSGKFRANLDYNEESDTYDPNDLGFLRANNERSFSGSVSYRKFEPFGAFNAAGGGVYAEYNRLYAPSRYTDWGINSWVWAESKNFWNFNIWGYVSPSTNYDYFEARTDGRVFKRPGSGNAGFWMGTDSRKKFRLTLNGGFWSAMEPNWNELWGNVGLRYRASDRLSFWTNISKSNEKNDVGFVDSEEVDVIDPITGETTTRKDIFFGKRDRETVAVAFTTNYSFNANMNLSLRLRHYWSTVTYNSFHLLNEEGNLANTDFTGDFDNDYDAFNVDLVYRWRFAPGSDIYVVWKNSLESDQSVVSENYFKNLNGLFDEAQNNSLSLKIIYFLDYASLTKKR